MRDTKKISITVPKEDLRAIDQYVSSIPHMTRSQFLVDCALQSITSFNDSTYISFQERKGKIMCHVTEICNLTNEIKNDEYIKEELQEEVLNLWRSLN